MKHKNFFQSLKHSLEGFKYTILNERNFRIHLSIMFLVVLFSFFYDFTASEYFMMFLSVCAVLTFELVNTAIENVVDLLTKEYNLYAKAAKDIMSAAVLLVSFCAAVIGIYLFLRIDTIIKIFYIFAGSPFLFVALFIILALLYRFIKLKK